MWQGEEIEFAITNKDPNDLSKSFAPDLLRQLNTEEAEKLYGVKLLLRANRPRERNVHWLANGGKAYVDEITRLGGGKYRLFEVATPEVASPTLLVQYDRAAEKIAAIAAQLLRSGGGPSVECYKTSIARDLEGNYTTRGAHESYRVKNDFLGKIHLLIPFLALRQLVCGSGGYYKHRFVMSPRQFFIELPVSETTIPVPFVCLRSESLSIDETYVRLQILNGDPTRMELPTFLRFALTSLVIQCIDEKYICSIPELENPIDAARSLSKTCDPSLTIRLREGGGISAVEYLEEFYLRHIEHRVRERDTEEELRSAVNTLRGLLDDLLGNTPRALTGKVEWTTKLELFERNFDTYFDADSDVGLPRETANNAYCAVTDPLFDHLEDELGFVRVVDGRKASEAVCAPPEFSRARARVTVAKHFEGYVDDIDWDHLIIGGQKFPLREDANWNDENISNFIDNIQRRRGE